VHASVSNSGYVDYIIYDLASLTYLSLFDLLYLPDLTSVSDLRYWPVGN
jgi:hypothetical protein